MKLLKLSQVIEQIGISRSHIYEKIRANKFPKGIKVGIRATRWSDVEVQNWCDEQVAARQENMVTPVSATDGTAKAVWRTKSASKGGPRG